MPLLNAYRQRCEARPAFKKALDRQMADFVDAAPAAVLELSCRHRLLAAIIVEAALGLAAQPARLDVFNQQRAWSIFRIGQPLVQYLHDGQAGVEADEIGKLERAHWMVRAEPHRGVDCLDVSDAFIE